MASRSAVDSIKGYFYQFDFSIESILNLPNDLDNVVVEGIEDIDINTATEQTAVQCKYYAKTEYNHSVIAEPVRQMLDHYAEVKKGTRQRIKYTLRGYYSSGHAKLTLPLDVEYLKTNFLTYKRDKIAYSHHADLSLNDSDLTDFISLLDININAKQFEKQFDDILKSLKAHYNCSDWAAEFYYNNSLRVIKELSIKMDINERTISKKDFLAKIDFSKILFNEWYIKLKGEKAHLRNLRSEFFTMLNIPDFERFFLIEINPSTYNRNDLKNLIMTISSKWSKISRRDSKPFCPYIYIHNIVDIELIELKKELSQEDFHLIDGFSFFGAEFDTKMIIKRADFNNGIKIKILNSLTNLEATIKSIHKTKEVFQFYFHLPYFAIKLTSTKNVEIQINDFENIKNII